MVAVIRRNSQQENKMSEHKQPLAEVFGFPISSTSADAKRYRQHQLCPYNNKVPNCTKDKAENPLGVCSVYDDGNIAITCPIRFRQDWIIAEDAANFFFPPSTKWTSLTEVRLNNKYGRSAGNIDIVLVAYDDCERVTDFGALEVQAVYISGNVRRPFEHFIKDPDNQKEMDWTGKRNYPRPDYLSSSRKRLAPQLIYKGGILKAWNRKVAVALNRGFFETLPSLTEVDKCEADIAWLVYDLAYDAAQERQKLYRYRTVYTTFESSLDEITKPEAGDECNFIDLLQEKLDDKLETNNAPNVVTLDELL
ncbi:MAG: NotI family restriction endonuclease [Armatimonadota bacterium]